MPTADCHLVKTALTGDVAECGDTGVIVQDEQSCFVALVDVLGHGPEAASIAVLAEEYLIQHHHDELAGLMQGLHQHLKGTRGAVAFVARLSLVTGELSYVGIGNICAKVYGADDPVHLFSKQGVVGYMMPSPIEKTVRLLPRDILVLCSDGVREHFELFEYPGLFQGTAEHIAGSVLSALSKGDDDASCLVMRCLK